MKWPQDEFSPWEVPSGPTWHAWLGRSPPTLYTQHTVYTSVYIYLYNIIGTCMPMYMYIHVCVYIIYMYIQSVYRYISVYIYTQCTCIFLILFLEHTGGQKRKLYLKKTFQDSYSDKKVNAGKGSHRSEEGKHRRHDDTNTKYPLSSHPLSQPATRDLGQYIPIKEGTQDPACIYNNDTIKG